MSVVERLQHLLDTGQFADVNVRVGKGNDVAVFKVHFMRYSKARDLMGSRRGSCILPSSDEISPEICLKNGTVLAFNKVCRFRKGYRCPQEEIYMPHELRFRVSQNIKLLGVGFGFLFSCTDMGITVHCQGPWETRQWTDITQSYCRVSGEKQETADVRLMFSEPVRIEKNHSYKVMVKIGRMSAGSSEVDLWGGTGAQYTIQTEEANFFFIKAAVDPNKNVEESDGDTKPGIITELLYQIDTQEDNDEPKTEYVSRRRRPKSEEEDAQVVSNDSSPWRKRHRPAASETPSHVSKISPMEEYKPMSFSTNRWRTKPRDEETESKPQVEEYKPSSFATNRWRVRPKEEETVKSVTVEEPKPSYSISRWRPKEENSSVLNTTVVDDKPSSFATNRWRTRSREEETDTKSSLDNLPYSTRKTSNEEKPNTYSSSTWRSRMREEAQPVKVELRKTINLEDEKSSLPFLRRHESATNKLPEVPYMRRRESTEAKAPEMPAFLRKKSTPTVEDNKAATPFGRNRWGSTIGSTSSDDRQSRDATTTRSRFLPNGTSSSISSSHPSDSLALRRRDSSTSRYSSTREPSLSKIQDSSALSRPSDISFRSRDTSLTRRDSSSRLRDSTSSSRFGPSSTSSYGSSYLSRYDSSSSGGMTSGSSNITDKYSSSALDGRTQRKYTGAGSDFSVIRSRFGSPLPNGNSDAGTSGRYRASSIGLKDTGGSSNIYGLSSYTGKSDLVPSSRFSTSLSSRGSNGDYSNSLSRHSSTFTSDPSYKSIGSRYSSSLTPTSASADSGKRGTDYSSYKYSNGGSPSTKYGSISNRYGSTSKRY
ncbi:hypothetical protein SK128_026763 [Halocaridina rubra]|uniref:PHR domain-containing protein n=1 Tax=Halocaridina rubra TaxID=373956 RepID=A0AAN8XGI5_HALRR